ncbi:MAG: hypothetical protein U5K75_07190 [Ahrensia sp.]|nr:hypothetical protein [Ahrensia sp.]
MSIKTLSLTTAILIATSSVASAECSYSKHMSVASAPVEQKLVSERTYVAELPATMKTDAWLVKYLSDWQKA